MKKVLLQTTKQKQKQKPPPTPQKHTKKPKNTTIQSELTVIQLKNNIN